MNPARAAVAFVLAGLAAVLVVFLSRGPANGPGPVPSGRVVVLYCAHDVEYSRPIKDDFEKRTGIRVEFLTDEEMDKSVGLTGRLLQEKDHPRCDVFWNNEPGNSLRLRRAGILEPYKSPAAAGIPDDFLDADGTWTGFAARARVILVNTERVKPGEEPKGLEDLTDPRLRGQVGIAAPVAGTTATHAAMLFVARGDEKARDWFRRLRENGVVVLPGNGAVMRAVSSGELAAGLTDTDDAHVAVKKGSPVRVVYPDQEEGGLGTPVLPNTVMVVKGCPHPQEARVLVDFLLGREVETRLAACDSVQIPVRADVALPPAVPAGFRMRLGEIRRLRVDWDAVGQRMPEVIEEMRQAFVK
ncbi:MAG: extracellular solute-binding protein [Planctomycetales bacterium]|nr:extracellular solute-binding protein [Planctomycetales bacterium]